MKVRPRRTRPNGSPIGTACESKRHYPKKRALAAAASLRRKGVDVEAYKCPDCHGGWTVGHPRGAWKSPRVLP